MTRVLALVPDAYGGHGGISQLVRDTLEATTSYTDCDEIVVFPRHIPRPITEVIPRKLRYETHAANSLGRYITSVVRSLVRDRSFDLILCMHIDLMPLAAVARLLTGARLVLSVYGIEVWSEHRRRSVRRVLPSVDVVVSCSHLSLERFLAWAPLSQAQQSVVHPGVRLEHYAECRDVRYLVQRYGLEGRKVIMTLGRLASPERTKGFDEVLGVMPSLLKKDDSIVYMIAGDGDDRRRLEGRARSLGVAENVLFTGFVDAAEKVDHYYLADAYVMPSSTEGFGFVVVEALATGLPVVASTIDATREVLMNGKLGDLVDPRSSREIEVAILRSLHKERRIQPGLEYFSFRQFERRWHDFLAASSVPPRRR